MRRTPTTLLLALLVFVAACGDDNANSDPASLNSCESVADAGIGLFQETLNIIDSLSAEELAALGTSEETPAVLQDVDTRGTALEARATAIGCTDDQMNTLMAARVDRLSSDSTFGQFLIESVRSGQGGFFGG